MEEYDVISIPISDGSERDFAIINTFVVEEKNYVAVSLIDGDTIKEGVYLYRYMDASDGDMIVATIDTPSEYKKVSKAYENID